MVKFEQGETLHQLCFALWPNCSMTKRRYLAPLLIIDAVPAAIGSGFAMIGFRPILKFAGAEWMLFALAFIHVWRRTRIQEVLTTSEMHFVVERG